MTLVYYILASVINCVLWSAVGYQLRKCQNGDKYKVLVTYDPDEHDAPRVFQSEADLERFYSQYSVETL